jgi:hypothetical protein
MSRLTDERLAELLELEAKATPGPWEAFEADGGGGDALVLPPDGDAVCVVWGAISHGTDGMEIAAFIAAARNELRALLGELIERRAADAAGVQLSMYSQETDLNHRTPTTGKD